jgi:hypothetical protein
MKRTKTVATRQGKQDDPAIPSEHKNSGTKRRKPETAMQPVLSEPPKPSADIFSDFACIPIPELQDRVSSLAFVPYALFSLELLPKTYSIIFMPRFSVVF